MVCISKFIDYQNLPFKNHTVVRFMAYFCIFDLVFKQCLNNGIAVGPEFEWHLHTRPEFGLSDKSRD